MLKRSVFIALMLISPVSALAQSPDALAAAISFQTDYQITPNITYLTANNFEAKLDVYRRRNVSQPQPTLIYIHGGGWTGGTKEQSSLGFLPFHGDADPTVPYTHALRLREALEKAHVPNRLVTVPGGKHGNFSQAERVMVYAAIREFLAQHVPGPGTSSAR